MPIFTANYPRYDPSGAALLPTPERMQALPGYSGRGVVIAFVDSGFCMHPDLQGRVLLHVDATTNHIIEQPRVETVTDLSWHGQMTSVIAAGDGRMSGGRYRGLASASQVVLVKVSSPRGSVKESDILRGLRWLIDTHKRLNVRVVNLSVGGDYVSTDPEHPLHRAVRRLTEAGVTVVAAAGNRGTERLLPPASAPDAIVIGGYDDHNSPRREEWTSFHNDYGRAFDGTPKPDVTAPAQWIASPILPGSSVEREARWLGKLIGAHEDARIRYVIQRGKFDLGLPKRVRYDDHLYAMLQARINSHKLIDCNYQHVDGTSVATAIVSSVVAQMVEANPALSPAQVRALLMQTAVPLPGASTTQQGAGSIDPAAAVRAALNFTT